MKRKLFAFVVLLYFLAIPLVSAQFNQPITPQEQATFDQILDPVMKIYNLVKYAATFIAVFVLLLSGVNYIISGSNPKKRENAKSMVMYVIIGLIIIWAAPLVVQFIVA